MSAQNHEKNLALPALVRIP